MRRKAPWFPFYAADWNGDEQVRLLPLEAQGAYVRLLAHSWLERSIPADPDAIGVLLGDRRLGKKLWPLLARFWEPKVGEPGRLVNARLERERREQDAYSAEQRERGKLGNASQSRARLRPDGDPGGGASAYASAHQSATQVRPQVAPQSGAQAAPQTERSVQSESEPKLGSLSGDLASTTHARGYAERASLPSSNSPEQKAVGVEEFAATLEEPLRSQLLASAARNRAEKSALAAKSPRAQGIDSALASGVYGEGKA